MAPFAAAATWGVGAARLCGVLKPDSELLRIGFQCRRRYGAGGLKGCFLDPRNPAWLPPCTVVGGKRGLALGGQQGGGGVLSTEHLQSAHPGGFELFDWQVFLPQSVKYNRVFYLFCTFSRARQRRKVRRRSPRDGVSIPTGMGEK